MYHKPRQTYISVFLEESTKNEGVFFRRSILDTLMEYQLLKKQ